MPASGFGVSLAGGALGSGNFGQLKPGMIGKQAHQALADDAGGAEDAGPDFLSLAPQRGAGVTW
jgi:hypothetical protein